MKPFIYPQYIVIAFYLYLNAGTILIFKIYNLTNYWTETTDESCLGKSDLANNSKTRCNTTLNLNNRKW